LSYKPIGSFSLSKLEAGRLEGLKAGKPGGCDVGRLKLIKSFVLYGSQTSSLSVILTSQPITLEPQTWNPITYL